MGRASIGFGSVGWCRCDETGAALFHVLALLPTTCSTSLRYARSFFSRYQMLLFREHGRLFYTLPLHCPIDQTFTFSCQRIGTYHHALCIFFMDRCRETCRVRLFSQGGQSEEGTLGYTTIRGVRRGNFNNIIGIIARNSFITTMFLDYVIGGTTARLNARTTKVFFFSSVRCGIPGINFFCSMFCIGTITRLLCFQVITIRTTRTMIRHGYGGLGILEVGQTGPHRDVWGNGQVLTTQGTRNSFVSIICRIMAIGNHSSGTRGFFRGRCPRFWVPAGAGGHSPMAQGTSWFFIHVGFTLYLERLL